MINAERDETGKFTNKGKANIAAAAYIVKTLHDYDDGKSLSLGMSAGSTESILGIGKDGASIKNPYGNQYKFGASYKDLTRDVYSSIGEGVVTAGGKEINFTELGLRTLAECRVSAIEGIDAAINLTHTETDSADEERLEEALRSGEINTGARIKQNIKDFVSESKEFFRNVTDKFFGKQSAESKAEEELQTEEQEEITGLPWLSKEEEAAAFAKYTAEDDAEIRRLEDLVKQAKSNVEKRAGKKPKSATPASKQEIAAEVGQEINKLLQEQAGSELDPDYKPGFTERALKKAAVSLEKKYNAAIASSDPETIDKILKTMTYVSYTITAAKGALAGAAVGSFGGPVGSLGLGAAGAVGAVWDQFWMDQFTEQGLEIAASKLKEQFPTLTESQANILTLSTFLAAGSTKAVKSFVYKSASAVKNAASATKDILSQESNLAAAGVGAVGQSQVLKGVSKAEKLGQHGPSKFESKANGEVPSKPTTAEAKPNKVKSEAASSSSSAAKPTIGNEAKDAASILRAEHLAKMKKFKTDVEKGAVSKAEKGVFTEDLAAHRMDYLKSYSPLDSKLPGNRGMDHVFVKYEIPGNKQSKVQDILIIESKFQAKGGAPKPGKTTDGVHQLSDAWVKKQIENLETAHPETYRVLLENTDKIRLKANVLDKTGHHKWHDYGKYNHEGAHKRFKPLRQKKDKP